MSLSEIERWPLPQLLHGLGIAATLGGIGFWGWMLLEPLPDITTSVSPPADSTQAGMTVEAATNTFSRWFDPAAARVDIRVLGLMRGDDRQAVMLAVNGAAPQVHSPGEQLGPSTTLMAIEADAIIVDQAGTHRRIPIASRSPGVVESLISARTPAAGNPH
jgi:general secretion pathway protein C